MENVKLSEVYPSLCLDVKLRQYKKRVKYSSPLPLPLLSRFSKHVTAELMDEFAVEKKWLSPSICVCCCKVRVCGYIVLLSSLGCRI